MNYMNTPFMVSFGGTKEIAVKFIRHYSDMSYPLEELLREDHEFEWIEECNISFDTLKRKLVEAPILRFLKLVDQIPHAY